MKNYKSLKKQIFCHGDYSLVPIRMEDRYDIMQWRNDQIYHLRQAEPLSVEMQDRYFEDVIAKLFEQETPNQILFSFLKGIEFIGYGGLVHMNWIDKNAEISFIMKTETQDIRFEENWIMFLSLIERVAFEDLAFHKIFTYAFDVRPHLYVVLEKAQFFREAILSEHCLINGHYENVVIHSKIRKEFVLRHATKEDSEITYRWANNAKIRRHSLTQNEISNDDHKKWFNEKINNPRCIYLMAEYNSSIVGSFRIDINEERSGLISYLLDPEYHGMGLGSLLLFEGIKRIKSSMYLESLIGYVKEENVVSVHLFRGLNFEENFEGKGLIKFQLRLK